MALQLGDIARFQLPSHHDGLSGEPRFAERYVFAGFVLHVHVVALTPRFTGERNELVADVLDMEDNAETGL